LGERTSASVPGYNSHQTPDYAYTKLDRMVRFECEAPGCVYRTLEEVGIMAQEAINIFWLHITMLTSQSPLVVPS
jgi:hypothetical protein